MRVVALVPGGIGDQILFFPTLDDLKHNYPNAQIDVVVEPRAKEAYRICKAVSHVLLFDYQDRNSAADWVNLVGILRDREYDVAISLGQRWFVGLLLWLTGIPTRIGYKGAGNMFLTNSVPLKSQQYAAAMYHDLLQGLGINSPCPELSVNLPSSDLDWAEEEKKRLGIHSSGYVLLGDGYEPTLDQSYPANSWQKIIQDFQQKQPELPLVVFQSPNDGKWSQSNPDVKLTSPPDVGKLTAMIAGADLLLSTEGVPLQLAVAVQTYTIALFGLTEPAKVLPKSDRYIAIKSPSGRIADISPQTVLERIWRG
ncbi:glycosyltransferase family 9 protein [Gloeocapsopsis dulcis]|uniref:Glycosyltransferase n=1 Tax=Gloeocapsopsis dulcis AAB1 = 1H9 TaxID=1433147 RepID=A0A6N8FQL4_9CHRO|nr:glycosyltransferase family 9 protein [Gloeocapsopsis dulcis]MUL35239.1 glycosyltransferase [Gloeocapsopsis dulcis AAB1 = 1H9]WNN89121.1 glycosyltransferase family 9 protein [Gloeocapsopsis dulcis]